MPRVSRRNPRADSSVDESPPKKPSQHTTAKKKPSSPSSKGTKAKAKAPTKGPHPKNSATATTGVATLQKRRGKEVVTLHSKRKSARLEIDATHTKRLTREAVADNPGITYQSIREIMKPYAKAFSLTDSIIQDEKDLTKNELFGNADNNVKSAKGVKDHLTALGHAVELRYHDRRRSLQLLTSAVINEEQVRRKKMNLPALDEQLQLNFVRAWKKQNALWVNTVPKWGTVCN